MHKIVDQAIWRTPDPETQESQSDAVSYFQSFNLRGNQGSPGFIPYFLI